MRILQLFQTSIYGSFDLRSPKIIIIINYGKILCIGGLRNCKIVNGGPSKEYNIRARECMLK